MHILDILQNSVSAKAKNISLVIDEDIKENRLIVVIEDDGRGMNPQQAERVIDPFFTTRTTRKVGLGIPLFKHSAQQSGGDLRILSAPGKGTTVTAEFILDNIDRPPLGDVANVFVLTLSSNPDIEFKFRYIFNKNEYTFDTVEVKEALEDVSLNEPSVILALTEMISENIKNLKN